MKDLSRVLLIVANAGSGKTYRLVTRCLELLARGEAPDRILALTFTRKAAAEFLQKLFGRLAEAARDPEALSKLREQLGEPDLTADQCTQWLRHLTAALPRLLMGTMDGFFGRIVRSFPFELGLGRELRLLDEAGLEENRQLALERFFAAAAETKGGLDQLVELLRQESRNRSNRSVFGTIESAARSLQQSYLETPPDVVWGDPGRIWPDGSVIISAGPVDAAVQALRDEITSTHPDLGGKARAKWNTWLDLAAAHRPPRRMDEELDQFIKDKLTGGTADKKTGELYVPVGNAKDDRLYLRGNLPELRENLRRSLVKLELEAKLQSSRALHALLAHYESAYHAAVRETGALTFADIALFLADTAGEAWRRDLDYRLDGRHDHWLLDEFQDTSRTQWRILEPLADEIIQDTSAARTFFYVGDTKQAIYGWRGGDSRLFWEIRDHYNRGRTDVVEQDQLEVSHRSARAIVGVVEKTLDPEILRQHAGEFRFPEQTVDEWRQAWVTHRAAEKAPEGYARFELVEPRHDDESKDEALSRHVIDILREVQPLERGLDCAILVRTNDELARYVAVLKKEGIPAAAEGKTNPCLATPAGVALHALVRYIASPADVISRAHAEASPWRHVIGTDTVSFAAAARAAVTRDGFAATVRDWVRRALDAGILADGELDSFVATAANFDATAGGAGDWSGFARAVQHRTLEENETPGAVRVMTVHQAKGLGVDVVILPELGGKAMTDFRETSGIALHRDEQGIVQWGLSLPRKDLCEADPVLKEAREQMRARQSYEALCVLYVAMTRAKKALYCLAAKGRNDKNPGNWLDRTFPGTGDHREAGDKNWFISHPLSDLRPPVSDPGSPRSLLPAPCSPPTAASPSHRSTRRASYIIGHAASRRFGTEVHRLLAEITWLEKGTPVIADDGPAADTVRKFVASARGREIFTQPSAPTELWRERSFDVFDDDKLLSGTFDRVHIKMNDGQPVSAHIYDFKTDSTEGDLQERHHEQLEIYRRGASKLLELPLDQVTAEAVPI
jgi:ATP-dependent exoDNAse (exonuclease V) beta subunit